MYLLLKRLELQGFKSFADKTILEFVVDLWYINHNRTVV